MNEKHIKINKIGLADNGKILVAHSDNEFFFWSLGNSVKKLKFEGKDLNQSTLQVDSEKSHIFFKPHNESVVYKINLRNDMQVEKLVVLPESIDKFKFVCNGDAIVKKNGNNKYYNSKNNDLTKEKIKKITLLDFEKAEDFKEKDQENTSSTQSLQGFADIKGEFELFKTKDDITSFNLVSNKGLEYPKVYENGRIVKNSEFYDQMDPRKKWIGNLLIGTDKGDCFSVDFGETKEGKFIRTQTQLFSCEEFTDKEHSISKVTNDSS